MRTLEIHRGLLTVKAAAILLALTLMGGCALPMHTVGLNTVLVQELGRDTSHLPRYRCTVGAHRGDSLAYEENTLDAVRSARSSPRYAFIESDVQYSADNKVVAFHDKRLLRVFGRMAKVEDSTYDELYELTGGEIATYGAIMDAARGKKVNIEVKSQGDEEEDKRLVDFLVADAKARKVQKDVLISSISGTVVEYVKARYPEMAAGQIFWIKASTYVHLDFLTNRLYREIEDSQADYIMLYSANLRNVEDLLRLKPKGKTIVFWTFDDTMYVVHKDLSDRMWGDSGLRTLFDYLRFRLSRRPI